MEYFERRDNIEKIEKPGDPQKGWGMSSAKDMPGVFQGKINHFMKFPDVKYSGKEIEMVIRGLLELYRKFHPPLKTSVEIPTWKGKAGIAEVIEKLYHFDVIRFRKKHRDAEPEPFVNSIPKKDVELVVQALKNISQYQKENIKTEAIAAEWCRLAKITENRKGQPLFGEKGFIWSHFFGWRIKHVTLTDILGIMDIKELIDYRVGKTTILDLDQKIHFQAEFE